MLVLQGNDLLFLFPFFLLHKNIYRFLFLDIDECLVSCKYANSTCTNLNGTFECLCPHGSFFNYSECQGEYIFQFNVIK